MKQWNWKRMIRVVLILLLLGLVSALLYRCATAISTQSLYHNGDPYLKVACSDKRYPLDHAKVDLSIGVSDLFDPCDANYSGQDHYSHFALYFSAWKDYEMDLRTLDISDYTNLEGHYFVKEISAQDAFSSAHGYYDIFGGIIFKHKESFVIPREILEEHKRDGVIVLKIVGFKKTDGQLTIGTTSFVRIEYKIIDREYVQFTF